MSNGKRQKRLPHEKVKLFEVNDQFLKMPNAMFDIVLPKLSSSGFALLCFIYRKTVGWGKVHDRIAYKQMMKGLGTTNSEVVTGAIRELLGENLDGKQKGIPLIVRAERGSSFETTNYSLNLTVEVSEDTLLRKNNIGNKHRQRGKEEPDLESGTTKNSDEVQGDSTKNFVANNHHEIPANEAVCQAEIRGDIKTESLNTEEEKTEHHSSFKLNSSNGNESGQDARVGDQNADDPLSSVQGENEKRQLKMVNAVMGTGTNSSKMPQHDWVTNGSHGSQPNVANVSSDAHGAITAVDNSSPGTEEQTWNPRPSHRIQEECDSAWGAGKYLNEPPAIIPSHTVQAKQEEYEVFLREAKPDWTAKKISMEAETLTRRWMETNEANRRYDLPVSFKDIPLPPHIQQILDARKLNTGQSE